MRRVPEQVLAALLLALAVLTSVQRMAAAADTKPEEVIQEKFPVLRNRGAPPIVPITDEAVTRVFPGQHFFVVGFRLYPVARAAPKPLRNRNLFAVSKDDQVQHLTDTSGLEDVFRKSLSPVTDDDAATNAITAWLRLREEFQQDGFFKFAIPQDSLSVASANEGRKVSGKLVVTQGGKGEIHATLMFDKAGKLVSVKEKNTVKPGVRPVCQATKLLDPDPVVRRMAERDILVMGPDCKAYLDEARDKASPEMKHAIDRIWQRIIDEGW
jgi:hypothetical protein